MKEFQQKLFTVIKDNPGIRPAEIAILMKKSRSAIYNTLRELLSQGIIERSGTPPVVQYRAVDNASYAIQGSFLYKDILGGLSFGMEGFRKWAEGRLADATFEEKVAMCEAGILRYNNDKKNGLLFAMDASSKLSPNDIAFDTLHCLDLYNMQIGDETKRTKEAVLLEVAKGSGNPNTILSLVRGYISSAVTAINRVIEKSNVDGIAFVPPTATRKVQVMRLLEKEFLDTNVHKIDHLTIRRGFRQIKSAQAGAETNCEYKKPHHQCKEYLSDSTD